MTLALFTGCGTAEIAAPSSDTPVSAVPPKPSPSVEVAEAESTSPEQPYESSSTAPEISAPTPADLLSDALNLFSSITFPESYTVYAAGYESSGMYEVYLTAEGIPEDIIAYVSKLAGDDTAEHVQKSLDYYNSNGAVGINGRLNGIGLDIDCLITPTKEDYDYDYVEGCALRLRAPVSEPAVYESILEGSYNISSLSEVAAYFNVNVITGMSEIYVRRNRNSAQITAVYNTVGDVVGVMERMRSELEYKGFDESANIMHLPSYGEVENSILFDISHGSICIFQTLANSAKSYKDYQPAATKLTEYGFRNYIETDAFCEYRDDDNNVSIAVNVPQWGSRPDAWENNCVIFAKKLSDYLLIIWYYPGKQEYTVQADKGDTSAKFTYSGKTGELIDEWSNVKTVREQFADMLGGPPTEDVYAQSIRIFTDYVRETFGMSVDALYALAEGE